LTYLYSDVYRFITLIVHLLNDVLTRSIFCFKFTFNSTCPLNANTNLTV